MFQTEKKEESQDSVDKDDGADKSGETHAASAITGVKGGNVYGSNVAGEVHGDVIKTETFVQNIQNYAVGQETDGRLPKQLQQYAERAELFTETPSSKKASSILQKAGHVMITGGPAEGKTTTALQLSHHFSKTGFQIRVFGDDCNTMPPNTVIMSTLYVFDDLFTDSDVNNLKRNMYFIEKLSTCVTKQADGNFQNLFILICQSHNLSKVRKLFKSVLLDCAFTVNITDDGTELSRMEMLQKHLPKLPYSTRQKIAEQPLLMGFPAVCSQVSKVPMSVDKIEYAFLYPHSLFVERMQWFLRHDMNKARALKFLLLKGGKFRLSTGNLDPFTKDIFRDDTSIEEVRQTLLDLKGTYLTEKYSVLRFSHSVIYDACLFAMDTFQQGHIWSYCTAQYEDDITGNFIQQPYHVLLSRDNCRSYTAYLAKNINNGFFDNSVFHPLMKKPTLIDEVFKGLDGSTYKGFDVIHGGTFLYFCMKSQSVHLFRKVMMQPEIIETDVYAALLFCIENNDTDPLQCTLNMLKHGSSDYTFDVNFRGSNKRSLLQECAKKGYAHFVTILINHGADPLSTDSDGRTSLHLASKYGKFEVCKLLLQTVSINDVINKKDNSMSTAVMLSVEYRQFDVLELLVDHGCELFHRDTQGKSVLDIACMNEDEKSVRYLFSLSETDKIVSRNTRIPIPYNLENPEVKRFLLSHGLLQDDQVMLITTPPLLATSKGNMHYDKVLHSACRGGKLSIVKELLSPENKASRDGDGRTPIMITAMNGHFDVFFFLVKAGCDASAIDDSCHNLLHLACIGGDINIVRFLLEEDICDIDSIGYQGLTPLLFASIYGCTNVFDELKKFGSNILAKNKSGQNCLHLACQYGQSALVHHIIQLKLLDLNSRDSQGLTPVLLASKSNHRAVFDLLFAEGCDLMHQSDNGNNLLHFASSGGGRNMVCHIVSLNLFDINSNGNVSRTPLLESARHGFIDEFRALLEVGADPRVRDGESNNILHVAAMGGSVDIVKEIIARDIVDINERNSSNNQTAAMIAVRHGNKAALDALLMNSCELSGVSYKGFNVLHLTCGVDNVAIVSCVFSQNIVGIDSRAEGGETALMLAAINGQDNIVRYLISRGCDPNITNLEGDNALHWACLGNSLSCVKYLISNSVYDINVKGKGKRTALHTAAKSSNLQIFIYLTKQGCERNARDSDGDSPLHIASMYGKYELVQYIHSSKEFDMESENHLGQNALMISVDNGHEEIFKYLVARGCCARTCDVKGNTILHTASLRNNIAIARYIVSHNLVRVDVVNVKGWTPMMTAVHSGHKEVFDFLVESGGSISTFNDTEDNILLVAILGGSTQFVEYLFSQHFFGINSRGENGKAPVMKAAHTGRKEMFDFLVERGADLSLVAYDGMNILHYACLGGNKDIVSDILKREIVDINSKTKDGKTPLMAAGNVGSIAIFELLRSWGCDVTIINIHFTNYLHMACLSGKNVFVEYVLSRYDVDVNAQDENGGTAVIAAANQGNTGLFQMLVSKGCDLTNCYEKGNTILHTACVGGNSDIVGYLLEHSVVDVNTLNDQGEPPVMTAACHGRYAAFIMLVQAGCDLTMVNVHNDTILHRACTGGNADIVRYVLSRNIVNRDAVCGHGDTALTLAAKAGFEDIFQLLRIHQP